MLHLFVSLQNKLVRFREEEDGATAVEYGLIVSLIAAVIIGVVGILGKQVDQAFHAVSTGIGQTLP
jgi:pilus assembly protein Flp/PilA